MAECGQKEVAEAMALQLSLIETVFEEFGEQVFIFGEGDETVANISGGKDIEIFPKPSGRAAIVRDSYYSCELAYRMGGRA
jgi:hypothetical protein